MSIDPVAFAKTLMACPSITPVDAGALDVLEHALSPMGFTCHRLPFEEADSERTDNLYARFGDAGNHLCFAGHTDVVPPGDLNAWRIDPFSPEVIDGVLYGRGAVDMKGAIACFVAALSRFELKDFRHSVSMLITGDEEGPAVNGTRKVLNWLRERNEVIDGCVVGEPTNPEALGDMIKIGRRGSVSFDLTVTGVQGHAAYPDLAANPIPYLLDILTRVNGHALDEGTEHFDPSNLEITTVDVGNPTGNVIPAQAAATFNIRFNDMHTADSLTEWVASICSHAVRDHEAVSYTLDAEAGAEAFLTEPGPLSSLVSDAVESVTGKRPTLSTTGGTSDARFIKDLCPVVECGLINKTAHKVDECISVQSMEQLTDIYYYVLTHYFST